MKKVLIITGSLREKSFNRQLAQVIAERLKEKVSVSFLEYSDLPFMNQDIEFPVPSSVQRVRSEVSVADGIWIVSPEYNYSYPGVLKNLLDWLSRPLKENDFSSGTAIMGKKIAVSGVAGKSAASGSIGKLTELLGFMRCDVMGSPVGISLTPDAFRTGVLTLSHESLTAISAEAEAFLSFIGE